VRREPVHLTQVATAGLILDRIEGLSFDGPEVLVKVRTVGDGASTAKAWQQSKPAGGNVPRFNFETFDIDIEDIKVDKLQLVAWDVSRGQVAPSGPGGLNDNFLGEVAEDVTTETEGAS
jgi:hypothetical protein